MLAALLISCGLASLFANFLGSPAKLPAGLLCIGIGLALGIFVQLNTMKEKPFFGIPLERCTWVRGRCLSDGIRINDDLALVPIRMKQTGDKNGVRVTASGTVQVFLRTERVPGWGEEITVKGNPVSDEESGDVRLYGSLAENTGIQFSSRPLAWRAAAVKTVENKIDSMGEKTGGFFKALFLGIRDDLGVLERELFRKAGCMHILALSGMHLAVLSGFLFFLFKPITGKEISFWVVLLFVGSYIFLTGPRSSLLRAGIMFALYGAGRFFGKKGDIRSVFLFSFLLLLVITPLSFRTLSFQLSFLALAGILYLGTRIMQGTRRFVPGFLGAPIAASIGAQCATAPLLILLFGAVYPGGIAVSLALTPMVSLYLLIGMIYLITPFASVLPLLQFPMDKLYQGIMGIVSWGARIPGIETHGRAGIAVMVTVCALFCMAVIIPYTVKKRRRWYRLTTTVFRK